MASKTLDSNLFTGTFNNGTVEQICKDMLVSKSFSNWPLFNNSQWNDSISLALKESLKNAISGEITGRKLAHHIVDYVDNLISAPNADIDHVKMQFVPLRLLIRAIEWKNLLQNLHEAAMAYRIYTNPKPNLELEQLFVGTLAEDCGDTFTQKMGLILREYVSDLNIYISAQEASESLQSQISATSFDSTFRILPAKLWPRKISKEVLRTFDICSLANYPEIAAAYGSYTAAYKQKFESESAPLAEISQFRRSNCSILDRRF